VKGDDGVREIPNLERYVLEVDMSARRVVVDNLGEIEPTRPKDAR
jgi:hypothetical protein